MLKKVFFVIAFTTSFSVFSQIGGQSVYQFLNLVTSPRQAAMGGKVISFRDFDSNQAIFNPATINAEMNNRFSLNYGNLFGEITYGTAAFAHTFKEKHTFHAGVNYINYGNFEGRDENGNLTSDFTGSETAVSFGYAYQIPNKNIFLGVNGKLISSVLDIYNSIGGALDLGALYVTEDEMTNITLVVRNLGTQFSTYAGLQESLPTEVLIGVSHELENLPLRWHLTLDNLQQWDISYSNPNRADVSLDGTETPENVGFLNNALRHLIIGGELFPGRSFSIRGGYNFRRGEELKVIDQRNFSGLSVGFGIRFNNIRFDYSYSRYTVAANSSLFGVQIHFK
jgi:hypothetical protein